MGTLFTKMKKGSKTVNIKHITQLSENMLLINNDTIVAAYPVDSPTCEGCVFNVNDNSNLKSTCVFDSTNSIYCLSYRCSDNKSIVWKIEKGIKQFKLSSWISPEVMLPPQDIKSDCSVDVLVQCEKHIFRGFYDYEEKTWHTSHNPNKKINAHYWAFIPTNYVKKHTNGSK